jgi:hypothetical protein
MSGILVFAGIGILSAQSALALPDLTKQSLRPAFLPAAACLQVPEECKHKAEEYCKNYVEEAKIPDVSRREMEYLDCLDAYYNGCRLENC